VDSARRLYAPRPALAGVANCIFAEAGRSGPMLFPATPNPSLSVFLQGASVHADGRAHARTLLLGPQGRAAWATMLPGTAFVSVVFRPGMLAHVLPPCCALALDEVADLAAWMPQADADALVRAVRQAGTMAAAVAALEDWLLAQAARQERRRTVPLLLPVSAIGMPLESVAAASGRSPRQVERLFRSTFGTSQRELRALFRYGRMLGRLLAADVSRHGLGAAALDCGYYDQAQMARDMRRFTGLSPRELMGAASSGGGTAMAMFQYGEAERRILLG